MVILIVLAVIFLAIVGFGVIFGAPFVPTRKIWIREALDLANIRKNDTVVDLGSGNGEVLKMAISAGAKKAVGYEINPILVLWSRLRFLRNPRIQIENENFLTHELPPETTVIYLFQVNKVMKKIPGLIRKNREKFAAKKIRVVCFGFELDGEKSVRELNGMRLYEF